MNKQFIDGVLEVLREDGRQICKQAGNSMTVAVVEMIFRQIDKAVKKEQTGGLF